MYGGVGFRGGPGGGQRDEGREQRGAETKTLQQEGQRSVPCLLHHALCKNQHVDVERASTCVSVCVCQSCAGRWGAACGPKTPAFTSISTDQRRWWIQRRTSTRKPAPPVDMNSPTRRCRHTHTWALTVTRLVYEEMMFGASVGNYASSWIPFFSVFLRVFINKTLHPDHMQGAKITLTGCYWSGVVSILNSCHWPRIELLVHCPLLHFLFLFWHIEIPSRNGQIKEGTILKLENTILCKIVNYVASFKTGTKMTIKNKTLLPFRKMWISRWGSFFSISCFWTQVLETESVHCHHVKSKC